MRLLRLDHHGDFSLVKYDDKSLPPYAILSHTWGQDHEEVTFEDLAMNTPTAYEGKLGYRKLTFCARQAAHDGLKHFWIDTCCIDRSSSAEFQENIISMYRYYQNARRCYVYLPDVQYCDSGTDDDCPRRWKPAFRKSRWFTRGWTLQELIAPPSVEFFSKEEMRLGDKQSLGETIHDVTGVPLQALRSNVILHFSIEERMSWAKNRETKRGEDAAYSLLGIFDVSMPVLYGEGREKAIHRLQKEVKDRHRISLPVAKGASFDSHMEEHNPKCLPNTRTELLHHIKEWARGSDSKSIFWLSGMAGTGKSTIARTVAHSFAQDGQLGASFFFKKGEGERGNAIRFFSTISADLAANESGMVAGIKQTLEKIPESSTEL